MLPRLKKLADDKSIAVSLPALFRPQNTDEETLGYMIKKYCIDKLEALKKDELLNPNTPVPPETAQPTGKPENGGN